MAYHKNKKTGIHSTIPRVPQMEAPCGTCGVHIIERQRFAFSGWIAHIECVVENVQGTSDRENDRFRGGYV